ncbi:MAG: DUF4261 domain-containing protein [Gordonia sp. (in: high G+C Gram-positive bacteria)]|uniref:DUF4261 domain-containing protein n=1 Tax=Gordonia sp. (in: high G+C Gram-positive bacteria) TaxID=84139 RepID=UPI003C72074F
MPSLAMLFQSQLDPELTAERLVEQLKRDFPQFLTEPLTVDAAGSKTSSTPLSLTYGSQQIALMGVPETVGDDLTEVALLSRLWPNETPAPNDYRAHTLVSVMRSGQPAQSYRDAVADASLMSMVITSTIAITNTVDAVYFGSANHIVFPQLFRELSLETLPDPILPAWVALNVAPRPDGIMTAHTRGLDMLGLMDVEIPESNESAEESFARIVNTAIYQLENGPVVGDGDTLGETDTAEIIAHHAPSQVEIDKTVLSLEFVGDEFPEYEPPNSDARDHEPPKRRWFKRK